MKKGSGGGTPKGSYGNTARVLGKGFSEGFREGGLLWVYSCLERPSEEYPS